MCNRENKPFKSIYVSFLGDVSIKMITDNDLLKYEGGVLDNKKDYPLSVWVKLFSEYEKEDLPINNWLLNNLFNRNDLGGGCYILLDKYENDDNNKKFNKVFMTVYKNLKANKFMGRTDEEKTELQKKITVLLNEMMNDIEIY